jgi:hypothetical protein
MVSLICLTITLTACGPGPASSAALDALPLVEAADTPVSSLPPPPPPLTEYSDWYARRLMVHKVAAALILPAFVLQYMSGRELLNKGQAAPQWARSIHKPLAWGVAGLFAVNTVTGVWNLWDARRDPTDRTRRTLHGVLMLLADAGFVATEVSGMNAHHQSRVSQGGVYGPGGGTVSAATALSTRRLHKNLAYVSMGLAVVSVAIMLPPFKH